MALAAERDRLAATLAQAHTAVAARQAALDAREAELSARAAEIGRALIRRQIRQELEGIAVEF